MSCSNNSLKVFEQIIHLLEQIKEEDYVKPLAVFSGSTLGKHFRHILDFYNCIVNANGKCELDYALRLRSPSLEASPELTRMAYASLQFQIEELDIKQPVSVISDFHNTEEIDRSKVYSTIGRELMYAYDHAVHHLAIIKIGLIASLEYISVDNDLGVAPSTIKYNLTQELNH